MSAKPMWGVVERGLGVIVSLHDTEAGARRYARQQEAWTGTLYDVEPAPVSDPVPPVPMRAPEARDCTHGHSYVTTHVCDNCGACPFLTSALDREHRHDAVVASLRAQLAEAQEKAGAAERQRVLFQRAATTWREWCAAHLAEAQAAESRLATAERAWIEQSSRLLDTEQALATAERERETLEGAPVYVLRRCVDYEGERFCGLYATLEAAQAEGSVLWRQWHGHDEQAAWVERCDDTGSHWWSTTGEVRWIVSTEPVRALAVRQSPPTGTGA